MFERFTQHARSVVVLAQDEARRMKHDHIGTEHLLLAMLREEEGLAAQALASLGITLDSARQKVEGVVGAGAQDSPEQMAFTPRAKKSLEFSLREALHLRDNYIGTEHLLLGLVREKRSTASRILLDFDADPKKVRNTVTHMLSAPKAGR